MDRQGGLQRARLSAAEPDQIRHAVRLGLRLDGGERVDCRFAHGNEKLATPPVRNMIVPAELIEHRVAADAPASLIEIARIVDARVDHLAVTRADPGPDAIPAFDDDDLASRPRNSSGGRETDNSGSDNEAINRV